MGIEDVKNAFGKMELLLAQGGMHLGAEGREREQHVQELVLSSLKKMCNEDALRNMGAELEVILSNLKPLLLENALLRTHKDVQVFFVAIKELGINADDKLTELFVDLIRDKSSDTALAAFIKSFPQILTCKNQRGDSLLHLAVLNSDIRAYRILIENGMDPCILNSKGQTIYHLIVLNKEIPTEFLDLLSLRGAQEGDLEGNTPLHLASFERNTKALDKLLSGGCSVEKTNKLGMTPLHLCMTPGETPGHGVARKLILARADVGALDNRGNTPLHLAVEYGTKEDMEVFESYPELLAIRNGEGQRAVEVIAKRQEIDMPNFLLNQIEPKEAGGLRDPALNLAIKDNDWPLIMTLIKNGLVDVNGYRLDGKPLWEIAHENRQEDLLEALFMATPAKEWPKDSRGNSPLFRAILDGSDATASICINSGANLREEDTEGYDAFERAAIEGHSKIITAIEAAGYEMASLRAKTIEVFEVTLVKKHFEITRWMIARGIEVEGIEVDGVPLIYYLAKENEWEAILELLKGTSETELNDDEQKDFIQRAVDKGQWEVVALLIYEGQLKADVLTVGEDPFVVYLMRTKQWDILNSLIDKLVDPQNLSLEGKSIFELAIEAKHSSLTMKLMPKISGPNFKVKGRPIHEVLIGKEMWVPFFKYMDVLKNQRTALPDKIEEIISIQRAALSLLLEKNHLDKLEELIKIYPFSWNTVEYQGHSIAYYALQEKRWELICSMKSQSIPIHDLEVDGKSIYELALDMNQDNVLNLLADSYKSLEVVVHKKPFYQHVLERGLTRIFMKILRVISSLKNVAENASKMEALQKEIKIYLIQSNNWKLIKRLSSLRRMSFKEVEIEGKPFGYFAAAAKEWEIVDESISESPELFNLDINGRSFFEFALEEGGSSVVCLFLSTEKNANRMIGGKPLTEILIEKKMWDALHILIKNTDDLKTLNINYMVLLEELVKSDNTTILKELIERKAPLIEIQFKGGPLLHYVSKNGESNLLKKIVEMGADVRELDEGGQSALSYALYEGQIKNAEILIELGATLTLQDINFSMSVNIIMSPDDNVAREGFNFDSLLNQNMALLQKYLDKNLRTIEESFDIRILQLFLGVMDPKAQFVLGITKSEQEKMTAEFLKHIEHQNIKEKMEIPAIVYPEDAKDISDKVVDVRVANACNKLRREFEKIKDSDLEGIMDGGNRVVSVERQRVNFEHFLTLVERKEVITGVKEEKRREVYTAIGRALQHVALIFEQLRPEERITVLSRFSTIAVGYCIDPYIKSSSSVYNMVREKSSEEIRKIKGMDSGISEVEVALAASAPADTGEPIADLRKRVMLEFSDSRDVAMQAILKESKGEIDTHAANWARRHFGTLVGTSFEGTDIYLNSEGYVKIGEFLDLSFPGIERLEGLGISPIEVKKKYIAALRKLFWDYFRGASFIRFSKLMGDQYKKNSQIVKEYYDYLVDAEGSELKKIALKGADQEERIKKYLSTRNKIRELEDSIKEMEANLLAQRKLVNKAKSSDAKKEYQSTVNGVEEVLKDLRDRVKVFQQEKDLLSSIIGGELTDIEDAVDQSVKKKLLYGEYIEFSDDYSESWLTQEGLFEFYKMVIKYERTQVQ